MGFFTFVQLLSLSFVLTHAFFRTTSITLQPQNISHLKVSEGFQSGKTAMPVVEKSWWPYISFHKKYGMHAAFYTCGSFYWVIGHMLDMCEQCQ